MKLRVDEKMPIKEFVEKHTWLGFHLKRRLGKLYLIKSIMEEKNGRTKNRN